MPSAPEGLAESRSPAAQPGLRQALLGCRALAEVGAGVHVHFARETAQAARRRPAHAAGEFPPLVVRRHDHEPLLLLALVDEVVDAVARPARPVLGAEVVEHDELVPARVRRRLAVAVALAQRVQPVRNVEEERRRPRLAVAPDDLAQDGDREVRLARAGIAAEEEALAQVGPRAELLRPLPTDGERVARVRHGFEVLERAAVVGGRDLHSGPALVRPALLVHDLLGGPAQLAVALGRKRLPEEDDLLGLELAPATEALLCAASGQGWRTWRTC